ncbi:MAG: HEAT repeat domain-containing protein [Planctomycetota bacterium]|jgi:HEAT repeat protein
MKSTLIYMLLPALLSACVSASTGDEAAYEKLTDEKLDELDEKLQRWSEARNRDDAILEAVLYRDLRREAGRLAGGLKLAVASSDAGKRAICTAALGFTEDTSSVGLLMELLRDSEAVVRANAMLALCLLRSQKTPVPDIVARLQDEDALVRRLTVLCLRNLYDPATNADLFLHFVEAMRDADPGVRINATSVLEELGEVRAAPFLARPGLTDDSAQVRRNAAVGLARLRVPDTAQPLVTALGREMNPSVRKEIITALMNITGKDAGDDAKAWESALREKSQLPEESSPPSETEEDTSKK